MHQQAHDAVWVRWAPDSMLIGSIVWSALHERTKRPRALFPSPRFPLHELRDSALDEDFLVGLGG